MLVRHMIKTRPPDPSSRSGGQSLRRGVGQAGIGVSQDTVRKTMPVGARTHTPRWATFTLNKIELTVCPPATHWLCQPRQQGGHALRQP
eukprot:5720000-Pyramimonas_sp.AAC.1